MPNHKNESSPATDTLRKFDSGAVRSTDADEVAYHLVPWDVVEQMTGPLICGKVLQQITHTLESSESAYLQTAAIELCQLIGGSPIGQWTTRGFEALGQAFREGLTKYGPHNWRRGMPVSECLNHAIRHLLLWESGDREEDHLGHALWNILVAYYFRGSEYWDIVEPPNETDESC